MPVAFINVFMDDVRVPPIGWVCTRTVSETQELLRKGVVEHLSLDHDMGACDECIRERRDVGDMLTPETTFFSWCKHASDGTKLVQWMIETNTWPRKKPTVHSANPVGRQRMQGMIERYWPGERDA